MKLKITMKATARLLMLLAVLGTFVPCASANTYSGGLKLEDYKRASRGPGAELCAVFTRLKVSIEGSKISVREGKGEKGETFHADIAPNGSFFIEGRTMGRDTISSFMLTGIFNGTSIVATYTKVLVAGSLTCIYSLVASPEE